MGQANPQSNEVPFPGTHQIPTVRMPAMVPFVERFVVPATWFAAGFVIAKLLSRPTVIRSM